MKRVTLRLTWQRPTWCGGGCRFRASSHGSCLLLIMLQAARRAIQAHSKRKQAELEEQGREQAALEPLSVPADVIVACLSQLTEVSALTSARDERRETLAR